ncbi:hypothetical protein [Sphingomonas immobilis]|uniref:Uncharacterized protein n=1 Tax=Sphingomonas immobilis TaxID=3063997 RepID=A0ABT8ZU02_9SPHN|nr:hypothetical protein [Sphingomonas sp. CA1-15]MDO7841048.1 hypothetical protein [Sphingomonas sp. CA1-15]
MRAIAFAATAAILIAPALSNAQLDRAAVKQKAWLSSNFATGLASCSELREGEGFSLSGTATVAFADRDSDDDGYDFAVADTGGVPTIAAHAINTKGTGATNGRSAAQGCGLAPSPRGTIPAGRLAAGAVAGIAVAKCSLSGDPDAPTASFTVPLSSFGGAAKTYVGHVTLIKREASTPAVSEFVTKKSYDKYQELAAERSASGGDIAMKVVASCDTSGLTAKAGKPSAASYDLAIGKKA